MGLPTCFVIDPLNCFIAPTVRSKDLLSVRGADRNKICPGSGIIVILYADGCAFGQASHNLFSLMFLLVFLKPNICCIKLIVDLCTYLHCCVLIEFLD